MPNILDGRALAQTIQTEVTAGVAALQQQHAVTPGLAALLVGDNPASAVYVRNKSRACAAAGIYSQTFHQPAETTQSDLLTLVHQLNQDDRFHGILVQLPLPPHLDETALIATLDPRKDVDGLHPFNLGKLEQGEPLFIPATPAGVQQILLRSGYDPAGRHIVICGRSNIVGKPLALLLMQRQPGANATVTVAHTQTADLPALTRQADILIAAIGRPQAITAAMVKDGAVVIDVGINRVDDPTRRNGYRLVGDVDFAPVAEKAAAITPVPGGVGPMTIAMLLVNTLTAAQRSLSNR